jgi:hypothetical protein
MKKIIFTVVAAIITTVSGQAQEHKYYNTKHEVGITIGSGATTEVFSGLMDFMTIPFSAMVTSTLSLGTAKGNYTYGDEHYIPSISAEYYYHVNDMIGIGGFVAFNGVNRDMFVEWTNNLNGNHFKEKTGEANHFNLSIIPTAKFDWLRTKYFGMYSKLGLGVSLMFETQKDDQDSQGGKKATDYSRTTVIPNLQASLLGIEFGSENLRGFTELGLGEQGILLGGIKCKF